MKLQYTCNNCGTIHPKWSGKCDSCQQWGVLSEETKVKANKSQISTANLLGLEVHDFTESYINSAESERYESSIAEIDRVFGGGIFKGSATLLGGEPGIGKSTILLQLMTALAKKDLDCLYVSAEESVEQILSRAKRLNAINENMKLAATVNVEDIISAIGHKYKPNVLIVDSIQTIYHSSLPSAPGTINQVRTCTFELIRIAKKYDIALILVGHITKDGQIAGPKTLEHMVDTVLYFEGDRGQQYRIIRAVKNRYGAVNEIGVFEMTQLGLSEVTNPSALFLSNQKTQYSGSAVFSSMEGTRPILLEIQALVVPTYQATPRRASLGWDANRLSMLIAVLNARLGLNLLDKEVYLNITGGLKIDEPAADLAVIAALIAAVKDIILCNKTIFIGEVGLVGEVRMVNQIEARLQEAYKLGFTHAIIPKFTKQHHFAINTIEIEHISELFSKLPIMKEME